MQRRSTQNDLKFPARFGAGRRGEILLWGTTAPERVSVITHVHFRYTFAVLGTSRYPGTVPGPGTWDPYRTGLRARLPGGGRRQYTAPGEGYTEAPVTTVDFIHRASLFAPLGLSFRAARLSLCLLFPAFRFGEPSNESVVGDSAVQWFSRAVPVLRRHVVERLIFLAPSVSFRFV